MSDEPNAFLPPPPPTIPPVTDPLLPPSPVAIAVEPEPPTAESGPVERGDADTTGDEPVAAEPGGAGPLPPTGAVSRHRGRRFLTVVLVVLTSVGLLASTLAIWSARQVLNTDVFVDRVEGILGDPDVQAGLATYLTDELMEVIDPASLAREFLPPAATPLVGPMVAAIREFVLQQAESILASDPVQSFLSGAVRRAHDAALTLLEGGTVAGVTIDGDQLVLNVIPLLQRVLDRLNENGLFGRDLSLPPVSDDAGNPSEQVQALAAALGRPLPADFGQITVFSSSAIEEAQRTLEVVRRGIVLLVLVTLVLLVLTFALSLDRWRTLAQLGVGLTVAMLVLTFAANHVDRRIDELIVNPDAVPAAEAVVNVFTSSLVSVAVALLVLGVIVAAVGFIFGHSESAARLRGAAVRSASRAGSAVRAGSPARTFVAEHASGARIVALVAGALVLVWSGFSASGALIALILVAVLLILTQVLAHPRGAPA